MTSKTEREARAAIDSARMAGQLARATAIFDALDANAEHLDHYTRYDVADDAWQGMVDIDIPIPDEDFARMVVRAAAHMGEEQVVDLVDAQFGERDTVIEIPTEGLRLAWQPFDECLILTYQAAPGLSVASILARTKKLSA